MIPEMTEIKEFPGYFVSKCGRIFSTKQTNRLHEMTRKKDKDGYLEVGLYKDGKRYFRRVHRLVAQAYIPNPMGLPQINHIDGIKSNNIVDNLEWVTCSENMVHSFRILNRMPIPTTNIPIQLTHIFTGENLEFNSIKDCARYLGITHDHLGRVLNGRYNIFKCKKLFYYTVAYDCEDVTTIS